MAAKPQNHTNGGGRSDFGYLIVRPENGGVRDILKCLVWGDVGSEMKFLESSDGEGVVVGGMAADHRWVILVSIIVRKIIAFLGKPMELVGYLVEFILNLLSLNGNLIGLLMNILNGQVVMPRRNSDTYISIIGHIDGRIDLYKSKSFADDNGDSDAEESSMKVNWENRALMDLCIMASKLAYENAKVVKNVVTHHWKMHFVDFYNCWNDYQMERSTQLFILCDKPRDANLILICFRGTEPFDADDWITDFDYSWYDIPQLGKIHMGFLEALGLGSRANVATFQNHLIVETTKFAPSAGVGATSSPLEGTELMSSSSESDKERGGSDVSSENKTMLPIMAEMTAYYAARSKLKSLLKEHKNAKFVVTGHSLGGALAIMFPTVLVLHEQIELMQKLLGVYTFGQPRIGNGQLGRYMEAHLDSPVPKYFRVVYCNDLVPRLPYDNKAFLYKHFGECLYYNSLYVEHKVKEEPNRNFFGMRYLIPEYLNAVWELIRSLTMHYIYGPEYKEGWFSTVVRVFGLVCPGISAHCPTDYVNSVRLRKEGLVQMSSF